MIVEATNCHRAYAAKDQSLAANFHSSIIDFKDMPMGSIQMIWTGITGTPGGAFAIFASNLPDDSSFDDGEIDACAALTVHAASGSRIWIRDRLAFRYAQVRWTKAGELGGTVSIVALGKKS